VRKRADQPYVYIVLLTAKSQKDDLVEGMEAGADDYLIKPFDAHELRARLQAGTRILDLQEQLVSAREALRVQATHDPLTGLWNRAAILDILQRELGRAQREGASLGVVMADLDHFKRINDSYGHLVGDAALRETGRRMYASVRPYDAIGRYGGEEFLIVVPGCNPPDALNAAERLRIAIGKEAMEIPGGRIDLTLSLGVTASGRAKNSDPDLLLRAADAALYQAKQAGRNRVVLATKDSDK
jgi:diguanylate cyclase (GGDEF)-like protein